MILSHLNLCALYAGIVGLCSFSWASSWELATGPTWRGSMKLEVSGVSYAQLEKVQAATAYQMDPTGIGTLMATADRLYDDGYVKKDNGTDNPSAIGGAGLTWNWGMNSASAYDSTGGRLRFRKSGGEKLSLAGTTQTPIGLAEDFDAPGWELSLRFHPDSNRSSKIIWSAGIRYFQADKQNFSGSDYQQSWKVESYQLEDIYSLSGMVPPTNPLYQGTLDGPGPLISNLPAARNAINFQTKQTWTASNSWTMAVENKLWEIRAGPEIRHLLSEKAALVLLPTLSLHYLQVKGVLVETFRNSSTGAERTWSDSGKTSEWIPGLSLEAGLVVFPSATWSVGLTGGYQWMADEVETEIGPTKVLWEPDAYTLNLRVGYRF